MRTGLEIWIKECILQYKRTLYMFAYKGFEKPVQLESLNHLYIPESTFMPGSEKYWKAEIKQRLPR